MKMNEVFGLGQSQSDEEPGQEDHPSSEELIHKVLSIALNQLKGEQHYEAGREAYETVYNMIHKYSSSEADKASREAQRQSSQFARDTRSQRWT